MQFHPSIQFAWYGSGQKWDDLRLQAVGCAVGGFLFWQLGLKVPQEILDNPALGALAGIAVGCIAGAASVFVLRLCWYPLHSVIVAKGGYSNLLRGGMGKIMWPAILMIVGVLLFVVFFGGGAIWFIVEKERPKANYSPSSKALPQAVQRPELSFEDRQFRIEARRFVLSDCVTLIQSFSEALVSFKGKTDHADRDFFGFYNDYANNSEFMKEWQSLNAYTGQDVEKIDPGVLSDEITKFLRTYKTQSILIFLVQSAGSRDESKISKWIAADRKAKEAFSRLRNSTSSYLKEDAPASLFSSLD